MAENNDDTAAETSSAPGDGMPVIGAAATACTALSASPTFAKSTAAEVNSSGVAIRKDIANLSLVYRDDHLGRRHVTSDRFATVR